MIKLEVLNWRGHSEFNVTPEKITEFIEQIERGEVEELPSGKYFIYDKENMKIIRRVDMADNQSLVMMPIVAGG